MIKNPLLNIQLHGFGNWLVTHLFGTNWQQNIWDKAVEAFETFIASSSVAPSITTVQSWINSHIAGLVSTLTLHNPLIAAMFQGVAGPMLSALETGLIAYAEQKLADLAASAAKSTSIPTGTPLAPVGSSVPVGFATGSSSGTAASPAPSSTTVNKTPSDAG